MQKWFFENFSPTLIPIRAKINMEVFGNGSIL